MLNLLLMILAFVLVAIGFVPVLIVNTMVKFIRHESIPEYFKTVALGFDQLGGSVLYNQEKFTVSSWTWYLCFKGHQENCIFMKVINFFFGTNHCELSFKDEIHEIQEDGELK